MSRAARSYSQSGVYHIVFRGVNQQNIFEESVDYEKLKETIRNVKNDMGFEIYAYCFMGNHVHIVLKERKAQDISKMNKTERDRILAELKGKFSVRQLQRLTAVSRGVIAKAK